MTIATERTPIAVAAAGPFAMIYRPDTADETVLFAESFEHDMYLRGFPDFALGPAHVVVQIGAHLGGFAVMAAARAARVYAIEASRDTYDLLVANLHVNHLRNVTASHAAITDRAGEVTL